MGKYDPLQQFLEQSAKDELTLNFDDIARLLGSSLPHSAYNHRAWWANTQTHVEAIAWLKAGWTVDAVDQSKNLGQVSARKNLNLYSRFREFIMCQLNRDLLK